jgi:hypothetical protein
MTHPLDPRALEAAALAVAEETDRDGRDYYALKLARAAVSAYLAEAGDGRLSELERENARMRAALETIRDRHIPDQPMADDSDEAEYARKHHTGLRIIAQRALAGSGEK